MIGRTSILIVLLASFALADGDALYEKGVALFKSDPSQALDFFEQGAEGGNVSAMVGAGYCYETGTGTEMDFAQAIEFYEQAAGQDSLKACAGLARIYAVCPDPKFHDGAKAVRFAGVVARKTPRYTELTLLAKAQARNMQFPEAGNTLVKARRYADHDQRLELEELQADFEKGIPDPATASEAWLFKAADNGTSFWAMFQIAEWCRNKEHDMYDPEQARMWYARAAKLGSAEGNLLFGLCCLRGIGGPVEIKPAISAFERAAASGEQQAFSYLGEIYYSDRTGRRDIDKAHYYYSQISGSEDQTVQLIVRCLDNNMRRVKMDERSPSGLYKKGEEYSKPQAYTTYHSNGNPAGTAFKPAIPEYALLYYLAAAESGYRPAMKKVASIYKHGNQTVHADPVRAKYWAEQLATEETSD